MRVLTVFCAILVRAAAAGRADAAQSGSGRAGLERHVMLAAF